MRALRLRPPARGDPLELRPAGHRAAPRWSTREPLIAALERFGRLYHEARWRGRFCWRLGVASRGLEADIALIGAAERHMRERRYRPDAFFFAHRGGRGAVRRPRRGAGAVTQPHRRRPSLLVRRRAAVDADRRGRGDLGGDRRERRLAARSHDQGQRRSARWAKPHGEPPAPCRPYRRNARQKPLACTGVVNRSAVNTPVQPMNAAAARSASNAEAEIISYEPATGAELWRGQSAMSTSRRTARAVPGRPGRPSRSPPASSWSAASPTKCARSRTRSPN